jgi:hypothetical protein
MRFATGSPCVAVESQPINPSAMASMWIRIDMKGRKIV